MNRPAFGSIFVWVLVAAAAAPVSAREPVQSPQVAGDATRDDVEIEAREEQARAACTSGRLQEGASILTELFAKTDDGNYLFNLACCYQHNGRTDEALMRFRAYLGRPDGDPPAVVAARQYVAELERPSHQTVVAKELPSPPPPARAWSGPRTLRMAGLVAGGIGLAALGTGTYFAVRTHRIQEQQDEAVRAGNSDPGFYEDQESGRRPKSQTRPGKA